MKPKDDEKQRAIAQATFELVAQRGLSGLTLADIARAAGVSVPSVERTRCALAEHGLQVAVHGWPAHCKEPRGKLDGWAEAHLVVASCSPPPQGAARWTLKLLGDHLVRLNLVESISGQTVGRALKKTS